MSSDRSRDPTTRVLWLTKGLGPGGAERLLVEHASGTTDDSFRYSAAYLLPWKSHLVPELRSHDVAVHCLDVRSELDPRWITRLARLVRDDAIDIVHAHSPLSASLIRPVLRARFPSVRIVYTEHNRWQSYNTVTRGLNDATYALNHKVFAVSSDVAESIAPRYRERVEVLVHGIDLPRVRAYATERELVRRELGVAPDQPLAVTVANLRADKAYPDLMAAAVRVLADVPELRFVAVGQGQLEADLSALHASLGLGEQFRFLGYRPEAARIIAAADVFVLASHHEGLPVAVMEALALGIPVVATAVGGLNEAITDGVNGLLVPARRPDDLARAIQRALDPTVHPTLAAGARATGERYSSTSAVERLESEYGRLCRPSQ